MAEKYWVTRDKGGCFSNEIYMWNNLEKPNKEIIDNDIIYNDNYKEGKEPQEIKFIHNFEKEYGFVPEEGSCELIKIYTVVKRETELSVINKIEKQSNKFKFIDL
jgi:hypothetical protein